MEETIEKLSETQLKITIPRETIVTVEMLKHQRESLLKQVAKIDARLAKAKELGLIVSDVVE